MAIVRWDPVRELVAVQDRLNRFFDDFGRRTDEDVMSRGDWMPAVDIYQSDTNEVVLKAELPGLRREDIDVNVENNTLTIKGERRQDVEVKKEHFHRVERSYGAFSRSFSLPNTIDSGKVRADYRDGVLTVSLPLREESKPRQIQVAVQG
jgi:HSP20 family protein